MTLVSRFGQVTPIVMGAELSGPEPAAYGHRVLILADGRALTVPESSAWALVDATPDELDGLMSAGYGRLAAGLRNYPIRTTDP